MDTLAVDPPGVDEALVAAVLEDEYGLEGPLQPLVSERDQNFRLRAVGGGDYVVKIASALEPRQVTEFQVAALQHLEVRRCGVPVPRVIVTRSGNAITSSGLGDHLLRVVTYLPGRPAAGLDVDPALAAELGRSLALLDTALVGLAHPGESQDIMWDMQRALGLREILTHVGDAKLQGQLADCLDEFENRALPAFVTLRKQVIHNDLNPANVLIAEGDKPRVSGIIDFGDMLRAPLVVDAAIAASYLRDDSLATLREFIRGYESVLPLEHSEKALLFDLVRTRLAATIAILHWRASERGPDDPYLNQARAEVSAERFFQHLTALGRARFDALLFAA